MARATIPSFFLLFVMFSSSVASADLMLTGMSALNTNVSGGIGGTYLWDTTPSPNTRFNLYIIEANTGVNGNFVNSGDGANLPPSISMGPGSYEYSVFASNVSGGPVRDHFGINLFFDGMSTPGVSVFAARNTSLASPFPPFFAHSSNTYGLDNNVLSGAGTLSFSNATSHVQLSDFRWSDPAVHGLDRITSYSTNPDSVNDYVATFTLNVSSVPEPSSLLLMGTCAVVSTFFRIRRSSLIHNRARTMP